MDPIVSKYRTRFGTDHKRPIVPLHPDHQTAKRNLAHSKSLESDIRRSIGVLARELSIAAQQNSAYVDQSRIKAKITDLQTALNSVLNKRKEIEDTVAYHEKLRNDELLRDKAVIATKRIESMEKRAQSMLAKAKTPEHQQRAQELLSQCADLKEIYRAHADRVRKASEVNIAHDPQAPHAHLQEFLATKTYKPFRDLTIAERRVKLKDLNTFYNEQQTKLEDKLRKVLVPEITRYINQVRNFLEGGNVGALAAARLRVQQEVTGIIKDQMVKASEYGKGMASDELGVERTATPRKQSQLINVDANDVALALLAGILGVGRDAAKNGLAVDAATPAIVDTVQKAMQGEVDKILPNVSGTIIAQNVNRGRNFVFKYNVDKIDRMQRTEVLDDVTCNLCLSLDDRVVKATDPLTELDIVHTNCRGAWVPIFADDENKPDFTPIPQSIYKAFETIDGRPVINKFKQLKYPINKGAPNVQEIIKNKGKK